jgi:hypothetical protein
VGSIHAHYAFRSGVRGRDVICSIWRRRFFLSGRRGRRGSSSAKVLSAEGIRVRAAEGSGFKGEMAREIGSAQWDGHIIRVDGVAVEVGPGP